MLFPGGGLDGYWRRICSACGGDWATESEERDDEEAGGKEAFHGPIPILVCLVADRLLQGDLAGVTGSLIAGTLSYGKEVASHPIRCDALRPRPSPSEVLAPPSPPRYGRKSDRG